MERADRSDRLLLVCRAVLPAMMAVRGAMAQKLEEVLSSGGLFYVVLLATINRRYRYMMVGRARGVAVGPSPCMILVGPGPGTCRSGPGRQVPEHHHSRARALRDTWTEVDQLVGARKVILWLNSCYIIM